MLILSNIVTGRVLTYLESRLLASCKGGDAKASLELVFLIISGPDHYANFDT